MNKLAKSQGIPLVGAGLGFNSCDPHDDTPSTEYCMTEANLPPPFTVSHIYFRLFKARRKHKVKT